MGQQKSVDVNENFTQDIEATIDDLFAPVKDIEIDPLTNEVKEKAGAGTEAQTNTVLEDQEPMPQETGASQSDDKVLELDLELEDVEFEPESPVDQKEETAEITLETVETEGGQSLAAMEQFLEAIMSLEWEIESATIQKAITVAEELRNSCTVPAINLLDAMLAILNHMSHSPEDIPNATTELKKGAETLAAHLRGDKTADEVQAAAGKIEVLVPAAGRSVDEPVTDEQAEAAREEPPIIEPSEPEIELEVEEEDQQKNQAEQMPPETSLPSQPSHEDEFEIELELDSEPEEAPAEEKQEEKAEELEVSDEASVLELDTEEEGASGTASTAAEPEETKPEIESDTSTQTTLHDQDMAASVAAVEPKAEKITEGHETETGMLDVELQEQHDALKKAVQQHLNELQKITKKILPVEKVLSGAKGMDKLHAFQKAIRLRLEKEQQLLSSALYGENAGNIQEQPDETEAPQQQVEQTEAREEPTCPWEKFVVIESELGKTAFPAEQIAYSGPLSGRLTKKAKSEPDFSLSWLKTWPWVKIKPSLSGALSELDEKELKAMKLPVFNDKVCEILGAEDNRKDMKKPWVIIMYAGAGKGAVLYLEGKPSITEEQTAGNWTPNTADKLPCAGHVKIKDQTVPVISMAC